MDKVLTYLRFGALSIGIALSGCQAFAPKEDRSDYAAYANAVSEARKNPPKAFEFECPATGCNFTKFTAYQTGGEGLRLEAPKPQPKADHPFVGGLREIKETIVGLAPIVAPIFLVGQVLKPVERMFAASASQAPSIITTTNVNGNDNALNGSAAARTTNNTAITNTTTTTTTDSHNISNSQNRNCQSGSVTGTTTATSGQAGC